MSDKPETPVRASDASAVGVAGRRVSSRAWVLVLLLGALAVCLYYSPLPDPTGRAVVYVLGEIAAIAIVFASLAVNRLAQPRAWVVFGAGMVALTIGDLIWYWLTLVEQTSPTTSLADVFYLSEYPLLIVGLLLMVRVRLDRAVVLDTFMISVGASVAVFEFVVRPSLDGYTGSTLGLVVMVAYPVLDVALTAVAVRSALAGNLRSPMLLLLLAGLSTTVVADIASLWLNLVSVPSDPSPLDGLWLMSIFAWAAAAVHPAARTEFAAGGPDWLRQRTARPLILAVALLVLPATLVIETASGSTPYTPSLMIAWAIVGGLAVLRMDNVVAVARASEERFRTIFDDSPAGMAISRNGQILLLNEAVRTMFAVGDADLRMAQVSSFIELGEGGDVMDRIRARARGEILPRTLETVGVRADGSRFNLLVDARDITLPDGLATIGFFEDQTVRKVAEETLRSSERRYRDLFESNPHPMWIYDVETLRFLAVNDAAVKEYGWSVEQFLAMTVADIRPAEELADMVRQFQMEAEESRITHVVRHLHADGSTVEAQVTSNSLVWDDRPARVALAIDITEQSRLEEQLRQAQKMEAVGRLAGGVAHDFNNLLTAISGYAHILRSEFVPGDARIADVDEILLAGERAATLTRQLLTFSRRQVLQPRSINLNEAIEELRGMLSRLIGEDVDLQIALDPDLGLVRADPGQLTQVLMNLAVNAKDAMPRGGSLSIETRNVVLDESYAAGHTGVRPGPHVQLTVRDIGVGMDFETQAHLFEPFFTTKEAGKGTGLGLATVYGIVRQSEGGIDVRSRPGHGTAFEICLPLACPAVPCDQEEAAHEAPVRGHETILVVEDEDAVRRLAVSALERYGYRVLSARGPAGAEELLAEHGSAIDMLLTDVVMPGGSGADLAAAATALVPALKVVMMSGYAQEAIAHHGVLNEGVVLLEKPFTPMVLLARVRSVLDCDYGQEPA